MGQSHGNSTSHYAVENATFVRHLEGIDEYLMPNGLSVLLFADPSQSSVTVNLTYLVGSRHEGRGEAGMAHLLEHMLFRGTPRHPNIKGALQDRGAFYNATTWFDRTNYFETLTATEENLRFALELEADRMVNSTILQADLDAEMTVVRNEFEMGENNPVHVLHDQMMSAAYRWHNYGKTTIGNRSDIERVPVSALRRFYENYYQPDNAVLMISGKIDKVHTLALVDEFFSPIKKPSRVLDKTYTVEPAQDGPRSVCLKRTGDVASVGLAYHVPPGSSRDYVAIRVALDCLTDEPGGFLYKKFVETGLCSELFSSVYGLCEPGMALCFVRPSSNGEARSLQAQLIEAIEQEGVSTIDQKQVDRIKARAQKKMKMVVSTSKEVALKISESIATGDWRLFFWYREAMKSVTLDDVQRVLRTYFVQSNRTAGLFEPTPEPKNVEILPTEHLLEMLADFQGESQMQEGEVFEATAENLEKRAQRGAVDAHIRYAALPKKTRGQVARMRLIFRFANEALLTGRVEEFALIPALLWRGCKAYDYQGIRDRLDQLQSTLEFDGHAGKLAVSLKSDHEHVTDAIALIGEMVRAPLFDEKEFVIAQKREIDDYEELRMDPQRQGFHELERLKNPWPEGSIHYVPTYEQKIQMLKGLSAKVVKASHEKLIGADHLDFSLVGDADVATLLAEVGKQFSPFVKGIPYERIERPFRENVAQLSELHTPDKEMAIVAFAFNFPMEDTHEDYACLKFANYLFGENMNSRLMMRVREAEGLSYGAGSWIDISRYEPNASFNMYAMCAPQNVKKARAVMLETWQQFVDGGVAEDELLAGQESIWLTYQNMLASDNYLTITLAYDQELGRTFMHEETLYRSIKELSVEDVSRALQKWWNKVAFSAVIAGDVNKM